jgi:hypothetical protein
MADETYGQSVLAAQLDGIRNAGTEVGIVKNFLRSETYAQTYAKACALKDIDSGNAFWDPTRTNNNDAPGEASAQNLLQHTTEIQLDPAVLANAAGNDLALIVFSASEVLAVANETTNREIKVNDVITTFLTYFQASQPTVA